MSYPPPNRYAPLADPPPRPPRRWRPFVLGLAAGLVLGGGGVGLGWLLSGGRGSGSAADAEAQAACTAIRGASLPADQDSLSTQDAHRWGGAGELAAAAAAADPRYRQLGDALGTVERGIALFDTGSAKTRAALAKAQSICDAN